MTNASPERVLIVLTGPVGGGKSTTALRLAELLRTLPGGAVRRVGVIDLDLVADMVRPQVHYGEDDLWRMARRICGGLVDAIYREGHDIAIVEGEFYPAPELAALGDAVTTPVDLRVIALEVSYEACRARVETDPSPARNLSRDPAFLQRMNEQFQAALPWLRAVGMVIDANEATAADLAETICATLGTNRGRLVPA